MKDLNTYDLDKLVNITELAEKLDATNRIKQTKSSDLANLEHKVIHQLLTNYDYKGPESMQGWLESDWWLTALPQQYIRFRGDKSKDMTVFLTADGTFLEKGDKCNTVEVGKNNIKSSLLNKHELKNLWLVRNYVSSLTEQAKKLELDLEETALIYGEINLPTYGEALENQQFIYNHQLGLTNGNHTI